MARWSSDAISRHVADVLLESISEVYRGETASRELREFGEMKARQPRVATRRELDEMKAMCRETFLEELSAGTEGSAQSSNSAVAVSPPFIIQEHE